MMYSCIVAGHLYFQLETLRQLFTDRCRMLVAAES